MLSPKGWYHLTEMTGAFPLVKCLGGCSVCSWLPGPTIFLIITLAFGHDQEAWLGKWILRNTYTHRRRVLWYFFVRVQCLPWHFPEFTALGIPDLGQFCVTTFSTGIKSNKEQLPLCAPAALGEAVLSYLPVFIGMHVGLGAGGHPVRKQVHGLLSREEWLRHTIDTPPSSDSAAGGDKWNVNALALDRFCAHNSPSVIFKQCEVGQVAHPLWASISSLAKRL